MKVRMQTSDIYNLGCTGYNLGYKLFIIRPSTLAKKVFSQINNVLDLRLPWACRWPRGAARASRTAAQRCEDVQDREESDFE